MAMSWENGLFICGGCGAEVESYELTPVIGGVETDYVEVAPGRYAELMTGNRVEMTPEQYERSKHLISILLCGDCVKERDNQIATRLLSWEEPGRRNEADR
jgi:hypothetical protein